jgi:hypothetical protein
MGVAAAVEAAWESVDSVTVAGSDGDTGVAVFADVEQAASPNNARIAIDVKTSFGSSMGSSQS